MNRLINIVTFVPRKVYKYTKSLNTAFGTPLVVSKKLSEFETYITKLFGGTTGACGFGKRVTDIAEVYACQDGVCFVVSCIGVGADCLQIIAWWVPGLNTTNLVTMPVSWGYKTFIWSLKKKTFPWKGNC